MTETEKKFEEHFKTIVDLDMQEAGHSGEALFIVRLYNGMDNDWTDVSPALPEKEAFEIWKEKTENATKKISFNEIDYFRIFPANTIMKYSSEGRELKT